MHHHLEHYWRKYLGVSLGIGFGIGPGVGPGVSPGVGLGVGLAIRCNCSDSRRGGGVRQRLVALVTSTCMMRAYLVLRRLSAR